jgi:hypothetical protein
MLVRDAIKSNEIFPQNYNVYRNDRGTLGRGVFVLVENGRGIRMGKNQIT